jgi:hypothetical protein
MAHRENDLGDYAKRTPRKQVVASLDRADQRVLERRNDVIGLIDVDGVIQGLKRRKGDVLALVTKDSHCGRFTKRAWVTKKSDRSGIRDRRNCIGQIITRVAMISRLLQSQ